VVNRSLRIFRAAAVAAILATPAVGLADIYTYTDADGTVHFTNSPGGDSRYRLYIRGNGWRKPGAAPGVIPVPPSDRDVARYTRYDDWIRDAATLYQIPEHLVRAVIRCESDYDPRAVSVSGARGLMQLMPDTARQLVKGRGLPSGDDMLVDPAANLALGSAYLATLMKEFGEPRLAVAAYNAGPARVREWWKGRASDDVEAWVELIPFDETRFFVRRVMLSWEEYRRLYGSPTAGARP